MYGDVYNTTVNVNGNTLFSRTLYPGRCCCGGGMYMNSCFGPGYGGFGNGLGIGLGFAAGMAAIPMMPAIVNGVWSGMGPKVEDRGLMVSREVLNGVVTQ